MSAKDTGVSLQRDPGVTFNANDLALSIPMVRWSSDPASLGSSASSGFSNVTGNLVNSLRCNVIAMQRQLIAERERCHKLEINQATERSNSDANLKAIVQCVEQGKAENRQLQAAVWKQRREIAKLRRQLHAARTQFSGVNGNGIPPKDSVSDHDGDFSDDEFGLTYYSSFSQEDQRRVTSSWGDLNDVGMPGLSADTADAPKSALQRRQQQTKRGSALPRLPVEHKAVQVGDAVGNFRSSSLSNSSFSDSSFELDKHVLKQRLSDTVAICQQLARSLDARSRNARAATSAGCDDLTANSEIAELENTLAYTRGLLEDDQCREQVARLEARLVEMEQANEQWQQYAEQRDQYARVLAQRCGELELALNSRRPSSDSQMSEEQLRKIDRLLLDQRQKMQLMDEAKNQVEEENQRLRSVIERLTFDKQNVDARLRQAVTRLKSSEARRIEANERIQVLEAQISVYTDDFAVEQRDRRLSQERASTLERQLESALRRLREYECGFGGLPHPSFAGYRSPSNDSMLRPNFDDGPNDSSIPLLVARGSVPQVADDSGSRTSSGHQLQPPPPPRPD